MKKIMLNIAALFCGLALPARLLAADNQSMLPSAGRLITAFVVVAMLIYASILFLKKVMLKSSGKKSEAMSVIGSCPLGQKSRLCMVDVGGRVLLLGVTPQQVTSLAELDPSEVETVPSDSKVKSFIRHLHDFSAGASGVKGSSIG